MSDEKIDISRALKSAITTGKVEFGVDQTTKAVKDGKAQMVVISRNCPSAELRGDIGVKVRGKQHGTRRDVRKTLLRVCPCDHRQR